MKTYLILNFKQNLFSKVIWSSTFSATIIDLFFTSKPELYSDNGVILTALSDHLMIYAIRKGKPIKQLIIVVIKTLMKMVSLQIFLMFLGIPLRIVLMYMKLLMFGIIYFNQVVDKHIPKKVKRVRATPSPWLNRDITQQMSTRDFLHRKL